MIVNRLSRSFSVVVLSAALFWSCASAPTADIRVHSAADTQAKIPAYKTYAWDLNAGVLHDHTGAWVPKDIDTQSEVQFLIDKKLRDRGLTVVADNPSLLVSLLIVADVKQLEEIKAKRGDAVTGFDPVGQGALLVEFVDPQTSKTIWLGAAEGDVRGSNSVELSKQRLAYAVDKLFDQLPH